MRSICLFIIGASWVTGAFAQSSHELPAIVVKARQDGYGLRQPAYQIISSKNLFARHAVSWSSAVDLLAGVDIRNRGPFGMQGDLSLRGSTFEQVAVSIDGITVNDPQTGHHNLDIPLTQYDLAGIETRTESASSWAGSGAFAGLLNFKTATIDRSCVYLDTWWGDHALRGQSVSVSSLGSALAGRVSFEHVQAKAARPNTDFDYYTISAALQRQCANVYWDGLFGYQKKDFGAASFYSNLFPEEEEHTQTFFWRNTFTASSAAAQEPQAARASIFMRQHNDAFILQRNNPTSVNRHVTYLYGVDSQLPLRLFDQDVQLQGVVEDEQIRSATLGDYGRLHGAAGVAFDSIAVSKRMRASIRLRGDQYEKWNGQESWNAALRYTLVPDECEWGVSLGRSFRVPSFTELYYRDAGNIGNSSLGPEHALTATAGVYGHMKKMIISAEYFIRNQSDVIDWTRTETTQSWQARNIGSVNVHGVDLRLQSGPFYDRGWFCLENIEGAYSFCEADKAAQGFMSKYALDILKHHWGLTLTQRLGRARLRMELVYNQRRYGETYCVGNIVLSTRIDKKDISFEPFVRVDNLADTTYSEVASVLQPGRWVQAGVRMAW